MSIEELRRSQMMAHLVDALEAGTDVGHYGRLVFAIVGRHFLDEEELIGYLKRDPDMSEADARGLYAQVQARDYSPPRRDQILAWQRQQNFPICPDPDNPDACNVYADLHFPERVYGHIAEYYEHKAAASHHAE